MILTGQKIKVTFFFLKIFILFFLVKMFLKFLSNFSSKICFCYNTYIYHFTNDGLNKGILKISQISVGKENKDQAYIVALYNKKALIHFDQNVVEIVARSEIKKNQVFNLEKNNNNYEGKNNDEVIKK